MFVFRNLHFYLYSNSSDFIFYSNDFILLLSLYFETMSLCTAVLSVNFPQGSSIKEHLIFSHLILIRPYSNTFLYHFSF